MRKILISLLLASAAATPAIAGPRDSSDRQQAREERQQAREERQAAREEARPDRSSDRAPVAAPNRSEQFAPRREAVDRAQFDGRARDRRSFDADTVRAEREAARDAATVRQNLRAEQRLGTRNERIEQVQERLQQRQQDVRERRDLRASNRPLPHVLRDRNALVVSRTPRAGTQPPLRTESRPTPAVQWSTNWRHNNRYDWQNHRRHHRSLFHLGFYFDPFGWGYSPYQIGWRLWPSYYSSRYWINDPWMYRLPYAPMGYRWIRYWNDALLVDTWTGEVVDMIPGFFW